MARGRSFKIDETWGETFELDAARTGPIVFHFRPTKYMVVPAEKRRDWEQMFQKYVGLMPDKKLIPELQRREAGAGPDEAAKYPWSGDPKETISGSNDDWDDCDYW